MQDECWLWAGSLNQRDYGIIYLWVNGKTKRQMAHRVVYENMVGDIPDGLVLDHLCRVHRCINPEHLEPVTVAENNLRGVGIFAKNKRKTHCPRGHEYATNAKIRPDGSRVCRGCIIFYSHEQYIRRLAKNNKPYKPQSARYIV